MIESMDDLRKAAKENQQTSTQPEHVEETTREVVDESGSLTEQTYTPNYKFKVLDTEKEFDEFIRPIIKDKDSEEKLRDLYTKAHGLDTVKNKYEETKEQLNEREEVLNRLFSLKEAPTYDDLFNSMGLDKKKVLEYAWTEWRKQGYQGQPLPYQQANQTWSPDTQTQPDYNGTQPQQAYDPYYDNVREAQRQQYFAQKQIQTLQQQNQEAEIRQNQIELDMILNQPRWQEVQKQFPNFRYLVGAAGFTAEVSEGKRVPVSVAVEKAFDMFVKPNIQQGQSAQQGTTQRPPTINTPRSSGSSPVKKAVRSLDDMFKARDEYFANRAR